MSPVPYRTIQCYYRHVTGMRNHQCRHARTYSPPPAPSSRGRIDGLRGSSTPASVDHTFTDHIHVNWTEASATQRAFYCRPLGLLPRPIPRFSRSHQPQECRQALKMQVFIGLDYGDRAKEIARLQISRRPEGGGG